jgi:hypothetical protein
VLRLPWRWVWRAHSPAALASVGVALAVAATRWAISGHGPALVVLGAEVAAGGLALALFIRFSPLPAVREELWMRLTAAGMLGKAAGARWRLASLALGRPDAATARGRDRD